MSSDEPSAGVPQDPKAMYGLCFVHRRSWLEVVVTGTSGHPGTTLDYLRNVIAHVVDSDERKLMVLDRMRGKPLEMQVIARIFPAISSLMPDGLRIAYVLESDELFASTEYGVLLALEAGFDIRLFSEKFSAARWLEYGSEA